MEALYGATRGLRPKMAGPRFLTSACPFFFSLPCLLILLVRGVSRARHRASRFALQGLRLPYMRAAAPTRSLAYSLAYSLARAHAACHRVAMTIKLDLIEPRRIVPGDAEIDWRTLIGLFRVWRACLERNSCFFRPRRAAPHRAARSELMIMLG